MHDNSALTLNDVVVSEVDGGHQLFVVSDPPHDRLTLLYQGNAWSAQYATARGAKLATRKGGTLWYTSNDAVTLEYLETFRAGPAPREDATDQGRMEDDRGPQGAA